MITHYLKNHCFYCSFRSVKEYMRNEKLLARAHIPSKYTFNHSHITCDLPRTIFQTDFTHIHIDKRPFYIFKMIDIFNREVLCFEISTFCGSIVSEKLLVELSDMCFNSPFKVISDNGSCYIANSYKQLAKQINATLEFTKAYTPEHNGVVERSFRTDKYEGLGNNYLTPDNLKEIYSEWITFYNTERPHSFNNYEAPIQTLKKFQTKNPETKFKGLGYEIL